MHNPLPGATSSCVNYLLCLWQVEIIASVISSFSHWKFSLISPLLTSAPCQFMSPALQPVLMDFSSQVSTRPVLFALLSMGNAVSVCKVSESSLHFIYEHVFFLSFVLPYLPISLAGSVFAAFFPWIQASTSYLPLHGFLSVWSLAYHSYSLFLSFHYNSFLPGTWQWSLVIPGSGSCCSLV